MITVTREPNADLWQPDGSGSRGLQAAEWGDEDGSDDSARIDDAAREVFYHMQQVAFWQIEPLEDIFARHAERWRSETVFMSSVSDIALHPSYQRIIGMGWDAVPLIIRELRNQPDHWFWALRAITDVDPVPESDRGKVERMRDAWIAWADANGIAQL